MKSSPQVQKLEYAIRCESSKRSLKQFLAESKPRSQRFASIMVRGNLFCESDHVRLVPPCQGVYRLKGVFCLQGSIPFVQVALMARGCDLPLPAHIASSMGLCQLVETDFTDIIGPDLLDSQVKVTSMSLYNEQDECYFQRACYKRGQLEPPYEDWQKYCICNLPYNSNQEYVYCQQCQGWFHLTCMGVGLEVKEVESYKCISCSK